jgi:ABC-type nitrate/sulfonate/bicarbonate transport system permease component
MAPLSSIGWQAMSRGIRLALLQLWLPVGLLLAWWFLSSGTTSFYFPALENIVATLRELWIFDHTVSDLLPSLRNMLGGFAIAVVLGISLGLVLGSMPRLLDAIEPVLEFFRALPAVAILPVAILVLGLGDTMRIFVITLGAVWPVLINTMSAVRGIDPTVTDVEEAFRLNPVSRYLRVRLPAALPQILSGARVALYISVALVVVSEMQGAAYGIGRFVLTAQRNWAVVDMWSGMIVIGLVGYLLSIAFRGAERLLLRGYPPARTAEKESAR